MAREVCNVGLYTLGDGPKLLGETRHPITIRAPFEQRPTELPFECRDPALHSGLVDAERLGSLDRAAMPGYCQEVTQVVPVEHDMVMQVCLAVWQTCGSPD